MLFLKADFDTVIEYMLSKSVDFYKKGRTVLKPVRLCGEMGERNLK